MQWTNGVWRNPAVAGPFDAWDIELKGLAMKVVDRETRRMYGVGEDYKKRILIAQVCLEHLSQESCGVFRTKPRGERWNWPVLACFFSWFVVLSGEEQELFLSDVGAGRCDIWAPYATWARAWERDACKYDVMGDRWYSSDDDLRRAPYDLSLKWFPAEQGTALGEAIADYMKCGSFWGCEASAPRLLAGEATVPAPPCQPFPQCVASAWPTFVPHPCEPFPQCLSSQLPTPPSLPAPPPLPTTPPTYSVPPAASSTRGGVSIGGLLLTGALLTAGGLAVRELYRHLARR